MDTLCDHAWEDNHAIKESWHAGCNFQLFTDGGYRGPSSAATGWALYTVTFVDGSIEWKMVAYAARQISLTQHLDKYNAFLCETLALEDGLGFLCKYLRALNSD